MALRRKVILNGRDQRAIKFAEELVPQLPDLVGNVVQRDPSKTAHDAALLEKNLRFLIDAARHRRMAGPEVTKKIGNTVAPWPVLRRLWEKKIPEHGGFFELDRYDGILYAARLALERLDELLADEDTEFRKELQRVVLEATKGDLSAEAVRELMREKEETRALLEEVYPPAREPQRFGGAGKAQTN